MNQLKELQTLLKALRLGETAEQLPLLLENAEKTTILMRLSLRMS